MGHDSGTEDDVKHEAKVVNTPNGSTTLGTKVDSTSIRIPEAMTADQHLHKESMKIISVVAFYFFVSISLVFLNKNIMSEKFEFPIFITWFQLVVALVSVYILGHVGRRVEIVSMIPLFEFDLAVAKKVMPLAVIFVGMVSFNNLCLLYVEVTFYQVARSTTICFTIFFTYMILGQETSMPAIRASLIVMFGFLVGSYGEVRFSWIGIFFGVLSSAFVSLYSIYVKKIMQYVDNDQWKLLSYNTVLSIFVMFPVIYISGEWEGLKTCELLWEVETWVAMIFTGIFGFLINIAIFMQIKVTSPLTNNISGTLKACIQTLLAMLVYRNPISLVNGVGIFFVISGSFLYSHVRYSEMKASSRAASTPSVVAPGKEPEESGSSDEEKPVK